MRPKSSGTPLASFSAVALQLGQGADNGDNEKRVSESGLGENVHVENDISSSEGSRLRQIRDFFSQKGTFCRIRDIFNWS